MSARFLLGFFLISFLFQASTFAEIYNCNGTWTNKPCEGEVSKTLPEIDRTPDLQAEATRKKMELVGALELRVQSARRSHGVELDISGIAETCRAENSSYEECMTLVNNADDRLEARLHQAKLLKEQEKTNKLISESKKEKEDAAVSNQAISINQDNSVVVVENDFRRGPRFEPTHPRERFEEPRHREPRKEKKKNVIKGGIDIGGPPLRPR